MFKKKKNRCLLFACIEKNIGDDLFIYQICKRYPTIEFVISSDANYGTLATINNLHFSSLLCKFINISNSEPKTFLRIVKRKTMVFILSLLIGKYESSVYIVGNAFKNYEYYGKIQSEWIKDRVKLSKKFFLLSTNFGPYYDERWKNDFEIIFSSMYDVCFRDQASFELFNKLKNVRYKPDVIFSLGKQKHTPSENKTILISIIDCFLNGRPNTIVEKGHLYEKAIISITNNYLSNGFNVVFVNSNYKQDNEATKRIINKLYNPQNVSIFNYNGNIYDFLNLYNQVSFVIATRLHPIICSFLFGIPVIPIVYDEKILGVLKSCNFNGHFYDILNIETLSCESVVNDFISYNFSLEDKVINDSLEQFLLLDEVLK